MPAVELRWSDYRGHTFRVVRKVDKNRRGRAAFIGEPLERGLHDLQIGTILLRMFPDGSVEAGRVMRDGAVFWEASDPSGPLTRVRAYVLMKLSENSEG